MIYGFDKLRAQKPFVKLRKCRFVVPSVDYLGHIISARGVTTDPAKIKGVVNW